MGTVSNMRKALQEWFPIRNKAEIKANLRRNWCFIISAMAFFCLSSSRKLGYALGLGIAFVMAVLIASQVPSVWAYTKKQKKSLRIPSILTAIGICWSGQECFHGVWRAFSKIDVLEAMLPVAIDIPGVLSVIAAIPAVYFVYFCVLVFWNNVIEIVKESNIFGGIKPAEWVIYSLLLVASLSFMAFAFTQTQAFYKTELFYDIIYTSDSPSLVKGNAYMALAHPENDLRQPLFAVFAAPFTGIAYLAARLIGATASVRAILINGVQLVMLFVANLMLTRMLKLDWLKRICFMALACCTYMQLLFTLMMEQYIVAYFWLMLCMYLIAEKQRPNRIALWGAGGSLLTSMVLFPFISTKSPIRDFKAWFRDMVKHGLEFVALMLVFCRFEVIFSLVSKARRFARYTGITLTFADKLHQYTGFIGSCLFAPDAGVNTTAFDHISWQLNTATGISLAGVLILALAVFSAIWNRDKKSSLLAAAWVGFSAVMLLGLGWGTKENGLILYALYFGWALLALLFQLVEKIESKLKLRFLVPVFTICAIAALLIINIPSIMEMVNFAITHYPA